MTLTNEDLKALLPEPQELKGDKVQHFVKAFEDNSTSLEAARLLRNCCALNPPVKEELRRQHLDVLMARVADILTNADDGDIMLTRVTLQFVSNFSNGESDVLEAIKKNDIIPLLVKCLKLDDAKAKNISASVFLLIAKEGCTECAGEASVSALCAAVREDSEFALFSLQTIATNCNEELVRVFKLLPQLDRLTLVDVFTAKPDLFQDNESLLAFLLTHYKHQASQILTTLKDNSSKLEPTEFTRLLGLFCELSATEELRPRIQQDKSLLIDTVFLLRMIHDVGKNSPESVFAPARKLSQGRAESLGNNPVHGFKRDLVRLIGNLCWDHDDNKNEVRECEGIPLLMDCTSIDGKNPLMTEWVIFTLRNLCKNNKANQDVVNGVDDKGLVSVELAKEYGVEEAVAKMKLQK